MLTFWAGDHLDQKAKRMRNEHPVYIPDSLWEGMRAGAVASFLHPLERNEPCLVSLAEVKADEWLMEMNIWPESIQSDEPPPGYFDMDESAFEDAAR